MRNLLSVGKVVEKKNIGNFKILEVLKYGYLVVQINSYNKSALTVHWNYFNI